MRFCTCYLCVETCWNLNILHIIPELLRQVKTCYWQPCFQPKGQSASLLLHFMFTLLTALSIVLLCRLRLYSPLPTPFVFFFVMDCVLEWRNSTSKVTFFFSSLFQQRRSPDCRWWFSGGDDTQSIDWWPRPLTTSARLSHVSQASQAAGCQVVWRPLAANIESWNELPQKTCLLGIAIWMPRVITVPAQRVNRNSTVFTPSVFVWRWAEDWGLKEQSYKTRERLVTDCHNV